MSGIVDGNHALLVGNVVGLLMQAISEGDMLVPTRIELETIDGAYTNRIFVMRPSGRYVVTVERLSDDDDQGTTDLPGAHAGRDAAGGGR